MNDIMKITKPLDESGLSIKGVSETIKNEAKEQKEEFVIRYIRYLICMLLGT